MGRERERERKREKFEGLGVWIGIGIWFRYKSLWTVLDDFCREFGSILISKNQSSSKINHFKFEYINFFIPEIKPF
jgi:hypothetical protein